MTVTGDYAYGLLVGRSRRASAGAHLAVRSGGAAAHLVRLACYVWPELPEDVDVEIDDKDLRIDTFRSSGAGGQHVNVTDSAVRITHLPTGIVVSCQNERSQHRNRDSAMKVLKARLYDLKMKEQQAKLEQISGAKKEIAFGSQIRSYVLHPYQLVKDHRTKEQVGDVNRVLDGDIDVFIKTFLMKKASGTLGEAGCRRRRLRRLRPAKRRASSSPPAFSSAAWPASSGCASSRTTSACSPTPPTRSTPPSAFRTSCRTCSAKARCRRRSFPSTRRCCRRGDAREADRVAGAVGALLALVVSVLVAGRRAGHAAADRRHRAGLHRRASAS